MENIRIHYMSEKVELTEFNEYVDTIALYLKELKHNTETPQNAIGVLGYIQQTDLPMMFRCKLLQNEFYREIFFKKAKLMALFNEVCNKVQSGQFNPDQVSTFIYIAPVYPILYLTFDIPNFLNDFVNSYRANISQIPTAEESKEIMANLPVKSGQGYKREQQVQFGFAECFSPNPERHCKFIDEKISSKKSRKDYAASYKKHRRPGYKLNLESSSYFDS